MQITKWNNRFIDLAQQVSTWSKDPRRKIGAVAVDPEHKRVLSTGYNGFPRGIHDDESRWKYSSLKSTYIIHAEMNCIYNAVYTGVSLKDSHLYVYGLPICHECAKGVIQVGVKKIFCKYDLAENDERWRESFAHSQSMFVESGVELCRIT